MKLQIKRFLCLCLAVCLMASCIVIPASAEETSATLTFDDKAKRTSYSTSKQVWEENGITFTNNKASSSTAVADYAKPVRLYASSQIVVEHSENITKIVFDANSTTYATTLKNSIGVTATVSSDKVTVVPAASATSLTFTLNAQVRLDAVTVYYGGEGGTTEPEVPVIPEDTTKYTKIETVDALTSGTYYMSAYVESHSTTSLIGYHLFTGAVSSGDGETIQYTYADGLLSGSDAVKVVLEAVEGKANTYTIKVGSKYLSVTDVANNRKLALSSTAFEFEAVANSKGGINLKATIGSAYCMVGTAGGTTASRFIRSYKSSSANSSLGYGLVFFKDSQGGSIEPEVPVDPPFDPTDKTAQEILDAAAKLGADESIQNITLSGKIIEINTPYNEQYGNITVTIDVDGATQNLLCYRIKSDDASVAKGLVVGDTITVNGELINYNGETVEFNAGSKITNFVATATADNVIEAATYAVAGGAFSVTLADRYNYSIWLEQDGIWVMLSGASGVYTVENVASENGAYKVYILATDKDGNVASQKYKNYIDVTSAQIGNAIIGDVAVNGNLVSDKAYVDFAAGKALIAVDGQNLGNVELYVDGELYNTFASGKLDWVMEEAGTYELTVVAEAAADGKEGDEFSFTVVVYDVNATNTQNISDADIEILENMLNISLDVADEEASLYTFNAVSTCGGFVIGAERAVATSSVQLGLGVRYGIYNVFAEAKDMEGKTEDIIVKRIEYKRPGGAWALSLTLNDEAVGAGVEAAVGETYTINASAAFSGVLDGEVKYAFLKEDAQGSTLVKNWSTDGTFEFTPVVAGMYGFTMMAKGGNAGSAEISKTITFVVNPADLSAGSVAVSASGNKAKAPVTLAATTSGVANTDGVLYRFDVYNEKTGAVMIAAYSPEATCTWIPARAGTYEIRVKVINQNSFGMYDAHKFV